VQRAFVRRSDAERDHKRHDARNADRRAGNRAAENSLFIRPPNSQLITAPKSGAKIIRLKKLFSVITFLFGQIQHHFDHCCSKTLRSKNSCAYSFFAATESINLSAPNSLALRLIFQSKVFRRCVRAPVRQRINRAATRRFRANWRNRAIQIEYKRNRRFRFQVRRLKPPRFCARFGCRKNSLRLRSKRFQRNGARRIRDAVRKV
jgi:hypothetical protein